MDGPEKDKLPPKNAKTQRRQDAKTRTTNGRREGGASGPKLHGTLPRWRPVAVDASKPFTVAWFGRFKVHPGWAGLIAVVNLVGIAYGFYYYGPQFARTPVALWPFVPDSPLAVLWAELALLAYWVHRWRGGAGEARGILPATLDALAFIGNVQVGLWTVHVLLAYADSFGTLDFLQGGGLELNTVLLVGHAGMAALALVFLSGMRTRFRTDPRAQWTGVALALAYYLAQDALDYFGPDFLGNGCGMRPHTVPCDPAMEGLLTAVTFGLTLLSAGFLVLVARPRAAPDAPA